MNRDEIISGLEAVVRDVRKEPDEKMLGVFITADEAEEIAKLLKEQEKRKDWISVKDDMPIELHSIFWPFLGTDKWRNAMWREQSDKVLVAVEFADGTRLVTTGETRDRKWRTSISPTIPHLVTHWMKMPDLPQI